MIVLQILKILGIVIACIIGLIILIILLALFTPFTYSVTGKGKDEDIEAGFSVKWLGGLVHIFGSLKGMAFDMKTNVAGLTLKKKENSLFSRIAKKVGLAIWDMLKEELLGIKSERTKAKEAAKAAKAAAKSGKTAPGETKEAPEGEQDDDAPKFILKLRAIWAKVKRVWEIAKLAKYVLGAPVTARAWRYFKERLFDLLSRIKPRKICGTVTFGMEDPASTAELYGVAAPIAQVIDDRLMIIPDMENKIFEMDASINGRIFISNVLSFLWKILTNKDISRVVGYIGRNL